MTTRARGTTRSVLLLHGPGPADPAPFRSPDGGATTLAALEAYCSGLCDTLALELSFRQAQDGDEFLRWILEDGTGFDAVVVKPPEAVPPSPPFVAGYGAALQSVAARGRPVIEVQFAQALRPFVEPFEPASDSGAGIGFVAGLGGFGYGLALRAIGCRFGNSAAATSAETLAGDRQRVLVLNGPNLNLLGRREPQIYGRDSLDEIAARCRGTGDRVGLDVDFRQSNHEGELVDWIQEAIDTAAAIVINAAAYTHTSIAIHDALRAYGGVAVELHISNPHFREPFRHVSYVSSAADAVVAGLGVAGYELVMLPVKRLVEQRGAGP